MKRERVFMSDDYADFLAYSLYNQGSDNRPERERMRKILMRAIRHELTDRQRDCILLFYIDGMKMRDIASRLGLSASTVSRHISAATRKLRKVASYYQR